MVYEGEEKRFLYLVSFETKIFIKFIKLRTFFVVAYLNGEGEEYKLVTYLLRIGAITECLVGKYLVYKMYATDLTPLHFWSKMIPSLIVMPPFYQT